MNTSKRNIVILTALEELAESKNNAVVENIQELQNTKKSEFDFYVSFTLDNVGCKAAGIFEGNEAKITWWK